MARKPLDKAEIEEGLRAEVLDLPEPLRRFFARVAVEVHPAICAESPGTLFIVAKSGNRAIFYDDVEEDFGIGTLDAGKSLKDCSLIGELRFAVLRLQGG